MSGIIDTNTEQKYADEKYKRMDSLPMEFKGGVWQVSAEDYANLTPTEQQKVRTIQNAQVQEKLKNAQAIAADNVLVSVERKREILGNLFAQAKEAVEAFVPQVVEYIKDTSESEEEFVLEIAEKGTTTKTLSGKIRSKDRRLESMLNAITKLERLAHNCGTVPQVAVTGDTNILNMEFNYNDSEKSASSDWEQKKREALNADSTVKPSNT